MGDNDMPWIKDDRREEENNENMFWSNSWQVNPKKNTSGIVLIYYLKWYLMSSNDIISKLEI